MSPISQFFKLFALIVAIFMISSQLGVEARPFADGSISGTILQPFGGNLGGGFGPAYYSNNVAYNPYSGYGFYG